MAAVSVITPTFDSADFIADAIRSVQAQTFADWEMVLVDDASSDATVQIIQRFQLEDHRIKLIRLGVNSGAGVARNTAIGAAQGRYIAFLDADDLWHQDKLQKQLDFMLREKLPFTFSFYDCMDEAGNRVGKRIEAPRILTYRQLFFCNFVGNLTGIYDTDFFGKIPISNIRKRQDWMVWLTVLSKIKSAKPVPESLATYRIRTNSISASKMKLLGYNFKVYRQFHGLNVFLSAICLGVFLFVQLFIKPRYVKNS